MTIKPEKVNNKLNRVLEHFAILLVTFLCSFLGLLYISMRQGRGKYKADLFFYLLNKPWVYASICAAIVVTVNLVVL